MYKYILELYQEGGCDYTIGCGTVIVYLEADTSEEAFKETEKEIEDCGGEDFVNRASIFEVKGKVDFDFEAYKYRKCLAREKEIASQEKARDLAERDRLIALYGRD